MARPPAAGSTDRARRPRRALRRRPRPIAVDLLERAHDRWDAHLGARRPTTRLAEPIGAGRGTGSTPTAPAPAYVLHMLDEFVHHGAEIALLRDLWRWRTITVGGDALVDRVVHGDASVLAEFDHTPPPADARRSRGRRTAAGTS